jgi:3-oxoacyl-[acyl-carrier protein] reductase
MGLLSGKTVVITGASKGIGKATAELFAQEGADLVLLSRNYEALSSLKVELEQKHQVKVEVYKVDVGVQKELEGVFADLAQKKIIPEILVNNAGVMIDAMLMMAKAEIIQQNFATNVYGTMYCSQLAVKAFIKKRKGSIINMSSIIGTQGSAGQSIYSSSKAAIIGFTKSLSKEVASLNIRVNAIAPGFIETDLVKGRDENFYKKNLENIGMKRFGKPEDVAKVALFLASDLSEYVTGQVIGVDGSMVI